MKCIYCGGENNDENLNCIFCGAVLNKENKDLIKRRQALKKSTYLKYESRKSQRSRGFLWDLFIFFVGAPLISQLVVLPVFFIFINGKFEQNPEVGFSIIFATYIICNLFIIIIIIFRRRKRKIDLKKLDMEKQNIINKI